MLDGLEISAENRKLAQAGKDSKPSQLLLSYLGNWLPWSTVPKAGSDTSPNGKEDALTIWRDLCDVTTNGNNKITSPNWFKKLFPDKLDAWTPNTATTFLPEPANVQSLAEKTKVLLAFPFVWHIYTNQVSKSEELEIRPESPNGLTGSRNNYFPCTRLQGVTEVPA